jgi:hypothetical protein
LEVLTTADLIDRDAAYDAIGFERCDRSCTDCPTKCTWFYTVKNIPAVNRWIPVEDALPDKNQKVLVFYKAIGEKNNIHDDVIATNWRKGNGDFIPFEGYKITHWMPLPEIPEPPEKE